MVRNLLLTIGLIFTVNLLVFSQSGALKGKVEDQETKEPIPFANIVVELGGTLIGGGTSDFDGNYIIKPIPPGTYDLRATYVGYNTVLIKGLIINSDQIRFYDIKMESTSQQLPEIVVSSFKVPLINKDETVSGGSVTAEDIKKMPNRDANSIATTVGGVFSSDGERGNVRGARSDQTVMYIDGIRVLGSSALPQSAIEQVSVYLGGLPAQYGDARGGIINVTTKGPSRTFGGGLELESSQFLDAYGYNRLGFSVQGPLIKGKKEGATSLLGFFISGDLNYRQDSRPTANGVYVANDETLQNLENHPLVPSGASSGGTFYAGEYVRQSNLDLQKATPNTSRYGANLSAKIDVRTTNTTSLTFGGQFNYDDGRVFTYSQSMFNSDKNYLNMNNTWRVFGRFTQRFPSANDGALIKNVYYSIQADYSQVKGRNMDPDHKKDLFKYGYLGKYTTTKIPTFQLTDTITANHTLYQNVYVLNSWDFDVLYQFDPSTYNSQVAAYTSEIYDLFPNPIGNWMNSDQLQLRGGLLNGQGPNAFYNIWGAPGSYQINYPYAESNDNQISLNVAASADIGNHEFKFGFLYEQRTERGYGYNPSALWTRMRNVTNFHIRELDKSNPIPIISDDVFQDTIIYHRKYDKLSQFTFDRNLRKKLGLDIDGLDFILVDSYDIDNHSILYYDVDGNMHSKTVDGDLYSIDMFSADELLNGGGNSQVAYYYGYDYKGNKLKSKPSFDDFFTKLDENGDYARPIPAYEPIYMAGYVQDKFAFNDLIFNVGLRVDRFDANQSVLKDPFLFYPAYSVKEVSSIGGNPVTHPNNMGGDYIVYVNDVNYPTEITGYRNGSTWYNADGVEIQDPSVLARSGGISPFTCRSKPENSEFQSV